MTYFTSLTKYLTASVKKVSFYADLAINGFSRLCENWLTLTIWLSNRTNKNTASAFAGIISLLALPYPNLARYNYITDNNNSIQKIELNSTIEKVVYCLLIATLVFSIPGIMLEPIAGIGNFFNRLSKFSTENKNDQLFYLHIGNIIGALFAIFICSMFLRRYEGSKIKENTQYILSYKYAHKTYSKKAIVAAILLGAAGTISYALQSGFYTILGVKQLFGHTPYKHSAQIAGKGLCYLSICAAFISRIMSSGIDGLNIINELPIYTSCLKKMYNKHSPSSISITIMLFFYITCRLLEDYASTEYMIAHEFSGLNDFSNFSITSQFICVPFTIITSLSSVFLEIMLTSEGFIPQSLFAAEKASFFKKTEQSSLLQTFETDSHTVDNIF